MKEGRSPFDGRDEQEIIQKHALKILRVKLIDIKPYQKNAKKTNRICYGMELDPKYVDVIVQRYVDYIGTTIVKLNGTEITWKK